MMRVFSRAADGEERVQANFRVREFACKDGTDPVFVDGELAELLQRVREHFGVAVTISSAYRTVAHNSSKQVGGSPRSQHIYGRAADIQVKGVSPEAVARYAETLMPDKGGIGVYATFTHVDVRPGRSRWDSRSGKQVRVEGWR